MFDASISEFNGATDMIIKCIERDKYHKDYWQICR